MSRKLLLSALVCLLFFSCKKTSTTTQAALPNSPAPYVPPPNLLPPILLKSVLVKWQGTNDSSQINFTYDGNYNVVQVITNNLTSGVPNTDTATYTRNSAGYISYIHHGADYIMNFEYGSNYYESMVKDVPFGMGRDSLPFEYNTAAVQLRTPMVGISHYTNQPLGYQILNEAVSTPNSPGPGTLTTELTYAPLRVLSGETQTNYYYDTMVNSLQLGDEAFVLGFYPHSGTNISFKYPHNIISSSTVDIFNPANNSSTTYSYIYNSNNMPVYAMGTTMPGGRISYISYSYY